MVKAISQGIQISVEVHYQPEYSNPILLEFMHAYKINILNYNSFAVQLLRRHWYIVNSSCSKKEVEGEGVIGVQPIIQPNQQYEYVSGCNLTTEIGKMYGYYTMENLYNKSLFKVAIPPFNLVYPYKNN